MAVVVEAMEYKLVTVAGRKFVSVPKGRRNPFLPGSIASAAQLPRCIDFDEDALDMEDSAFRQLLAQALVDVRALGDHAEEIDSVLYGEHSMPCRVDKWNDTAASMGVLSSLPEMPEGSYAEEYGGGLLVEYKNAKLFLEELCCADELEDGVDENLIIGYKIVVSPPPLMEEEDFIEEDVHPPSAKKQRK